MRIHKDLSQLSEIVNPCITMGSFDGVHKGHKELFEQLKSMAKEIDGESVVVTFDPHPRSVVYPSDTTLKLLTTLDEKISLIEKTGVDHLVIVNFTIEFSQLSADEYIEKFVVEKFHPKRILFGHDHRFGLNRQGDIHFMKYYSEKFGYQIVDIGGITSNDIVISSSKIRRLIENKQIAEANEMLGYPFGLSGEVVPGDQIGRAIGYPTANIKITDKYKLTPPPGIYAAFVELDKTKKKAMLYIGSRPTINDQNIQSIEVNILDFTERIYGERLTISVIGFIRDDMKFKDLEALKDQIDRDRMLIIAQLEQQSNS